MTQCIRLLAALAVLLLSQPASAQDKHPLRLDDLFGLSNLYSSTLSPDGEWIAAVVIRPVGPGEVYGRTFYEQDITRGDIWLISRRSGERRNLTRGAGTASGYWCASWSPDGSKLAMLSTQAEGNEPRGGDNVRLYVWSRDKDKPVRLTSHGMMAQTLGGSALYKVDLRDWNGGTAETAQCGDRDNAPYLWLDNDSLLAVTLPQGQAAGILDSMSRGLRHAAATRERLREGVEPTVTAVESGGSSRPAPMQASLRKIDVTAARAREIAAVPAYPLEGVLQVSLAPDRRSAAVLATVGGIPPASGEPYASPFASWAMERTLGFVELEPGSAVRWLPPPPAERKYILDLMPWSKDGRAVAFRARGAVTSPAQDLFVASTRDLSVTQLNPKDMSASVTTSDADVAAPFTVQWTDDGRLLARAIRKDELQVPGKRPSGAQRADWFLFSRSAAPVNLTADMKTVPAQWRPLSDGRFAGLADEALWSLDPRSRKVSRLTTQALPEGAGILWSRTLGASPELLIAGRPKQGVKPLLRLSLRNKTAVMTAISLPATTAEFAAYAPDHALMTFHDRAPDGTFLWVTDAQGRNGARLLTLNEHLAAVAPGETRLIDYRGADGDALKAAVLLPPDYQPGRKYPVVVWVYAGVRLRDIDHDMLGLYQPGEYNLPLYAAHGYVVLVPSMPLKPRGGKNDDFIELPKGVLPAVDRLVELGIADPDRLAVMGQSYGGFSTYGLVTYTHRFKAAIAMAGITDLVSVYGQFDTTARDYPGVEHRKSINWGLLEAGQAGMGVPPWEDLWRYLRNSPLYFADRVQTPLLLVHGEQDVRGPMTQAEEFFYALYRQGKRARLLRYWGEGHGLRLSPANVRNLVDEILAWLALNLPEKHPQPRPDPPG